MIIIDTKLAELSSAGKKIRVWLIGAGFMSKGIANQIINYSKWIELVAIANRTLEKAIECFKYAEIFDIWHASTQNEFNTLVEKGIPIATDNPFFLTQSDFIDVIVEVTGTIEYALKVIIDAIDQNKHVVLMNAELDSTLGPILKLKADKKGIIYTNADWDQPGVIMNLYRFVKGIWIKPVLCGNIKWLHDPYRNPETQKWFAEKWGQNPSMVTSFADWSKISFEQSIVANATSMSVAKRGMNWINMPLGTPITETVNLFSKEHLEIEGWIVDYVVWATPSPGVFVIGTCNDPKQKHYLNLYKLWEGPYYCFYTPYHLCHFEVPNTIARAFLLHDATLAPAGAPKVTVITIAKKDLKKWEALDWIGNFMVYWVCENFNTSCNENLLPLWLSENCILKRNISKDEPISFEDVILPPWRLCDEIWNEQIAFFW